MRVFINTKSNVSHAHEGNCKQTNKHFGVIVRTFWCHCKDILVSFQICKDIHNYTYHTVQGKHPVHGCYRVRVSKSVGSLHQEENSHSQ